MIRSESKLARAPEGDNVNQQEGKEATFRDIHSTAIIGDGSRVYNFVYIGEYVEIGENCLIANFVHIDHDVKIGHNSKIMCMVHIPEYTKIGNNCVIYPNTCLSNEKYPPTGKKVDLIIEDNCIVGSGSIINAGVRLGEGCVVGAGSLVTKSVQPRTVVFGHPAHRQFSREDYDKKQQEFLSQKPS
jgi:acetyltransferase-like isoleucine patch superfamily enzyme